MKFLFDSNIIIYYLNGILNLQGEELLREGLMNSGAYSVISKIEVLGFQQSTKVDLQAKELFANLREIALNAEIAEQTIALRKLYKIKIPDAIIAATAMTQKLQLITRNSRDFSQVTGLLLVNPFREN
jgi:toxin FitB